MPEATPAAELLPGHTSEAQSYAARLGLFSGTMMVVGGIIGSGIFLNPAIVAQRVHSVRLILLAWVMGGIVALAGALVYAELGSRRPQAGGGYIYLREAYGRLPAFLYAWTLLLVIATGAIAAVAVTFASYTTTLLDCRPPPECRWRLGRLLCSPRSTIWARAPAPSLRTCLPSSNSPRWHSSSWRDSPAPALELPPRQHRP